MDTRERVKRTIYLPRDVADWLAGRAAGNSRSVNGELVALIREQMGKQERKGGKGQ